MVLVLARWSEAENLAVEIDRRLRTHSAENPQSAPRHAPLAASPFWSVRVRTVARSMRGRSGS